MADDIDAGVLSADLARLSRELDDTSTSARALERETTRVEDRFDTLETALARVSSALDGINKSAGALSAPRAAAGASSGSRSSTAASVFTTTATAIGAAADTATLARSGSKAVGKFRNSTAYNTVGSAYLDTQPKVAKAATDFGAGAMGRATGALKALKGGFSSLFPSLSLFFTSAGVLIRTTRAWTLAQAALNFVFVANPILGIVAVVVALGAAFYLAYNKIGWFHNAVNAVFGWVRSHWPLLLAILIGPFGLAVAFIIRHVGRIIAVIRSMPGRITAIARTIWSGFRNAADSVVHTVANRLRQLVSFVGNQLVHGVSGAARAVWRAFSNAADGAVHWVANRLRDLVSMITRIPGQIANAVRGLGGGILGAGVSIVSHVVRATTGGGRSTSGTTKRSARSLGPDALELLRNQGGPTTYGVDVGGPLPKQAKAAKTTVRVVKHHIPVHFDLDGRALFKAFMEIVEDVEAAL